MSANKRGPSDVLAVPKRTGDLPKCNNSKGGAHWACAKPCAGRQNDMSRKTALTNYVQDQRSLVLKSEMENSPHTRKIHNLAKFKLEQWLAQNRQDLEERRDRLYQLLEDEDDGYRNEMVQQHESQQANQLEHMRKRVSVLRAKREEHHKKFVNDKLDQCFQNQCEQMRTLLSKRMTKEIVQDWGAQLELKNRLECESQKEELLWACLSQLDVEEKEKREEAYNALRQEAVKRGLEDLKKQVELKKLKKAEEHQIKLRELAILTADQKALQDEKDRLREKEERFIRTKAHVKDMIETRDYYRDRKIKREEVAGREFLKKAVRQLWIEEEDRGKKKRELMRAIQVYRDYCRQRDCLENAKEDVVQRIIDEVIEEQHAKVIESRRREHEQRRELHCSVLAGRRYQIEDGKRRREQEEVDRKKELDLVKADWHQFMQELEQEKHLEEQTRMQYRADLQEQIQYQAKIKDRELKESKREDEMCELEENLFQNQLQKTLKQANLTMSNPYRQCLVGKPNVQCFRPV